MRTLAIAVAATLAAGTFVPVARPARVIAAALQTLAPGDPAPPFVLTGSDGRTYRLADYRGKQAVVLAWFAKAFTGG